MKGKTKHLLQMKAEITNLLQMKAKIKKILQTSGGGILGSNPASKFRKVPDSKFIPFLNLSTKLSDRGRILKSWPFVELERISNRPFVLL